jgi:hypothetical protein
LIKRAGGGIVGDVDIGPAIVVKIGSEHAQAEGAVGGKNSRGLGDIGEGIVAVVVKRIFLPPVGRADRKLPDPFVEAGSDSNWRCGEIHINVVAAKRPFIRSEPQSSAGLAASLAVPRCCRTFCRRRDRTVVIVVADAHALSPASVNQTGFSLTS